MSAINPEHNSDAEWKGCPAGAVGGMAARLRRRTLVRKSAAASGIVVSALLLAAAVWRFEASRQPAPVVQTFDVSCRDVREHLEEYRTRRLSPEWLASIELHLAHCEGCRRRAAEASPAPPQARLAPSGRTVILARGR